MFYSLSVLAAIFVYESSAHVACNSGAQITYIGVQCETAEYIHIPGKSAAELNALCPDHTLYDTHGAYVDCIKTEGMVHRHAKHGRGRTKCKFGNKLICKGTVALPSIDRGCARAQCGEDGVDPTDSVLSKCFPGDSDYEWYQSQGDAHAVTACAGLHTSRKAVEKGWTGKTFVGEKEILCHGYIPGYPVLYQPLCRRTAAHTDYLDELSALVAEENLLNLELEEENLLNLELEEEIQLLRRKDARSRRESKYEYHRL